MRLKSKMLVLAMMKICWVELVLGVGVQIVRYITIARVVTTIVTVVNVDNQVQQHIQQQEQEQELRQQQQYRRQEQGQGLFLKNMKGVAAIITIKNQWILIKKVVTTTVLI